MILKLRKYQSNPSSIPKLCLMVPHLQSQSPMRLAAVSRYPLDVPFQDKDTAKLLGARWDSISLKWYVQLDGRGKCTRTGNPLSAFARWDPRIPRPASSSPAFNAPESDRRIHRVADDIDISSDSERSSDVSSKSRKKLVMQRSHTHSRVREDEVEDCPKLKKFKRTPNVASSDEDGDSLIAGEEDLSPVSPQASEEERFTVGIRCKRLCDFGSSSCLRCSQLLQRRIRLCVPSSYKGPIVVIM